MTIVATKVFDNSFNDFDLQARPQRRIIVLASAFVEKLPVNFYSHKTWYCVEIR